MGIAKYIFYILIFISFFLPYTVAAQNKSIKIFDWNDAYLYNFYSACPISSGDIWIVGSHGQIAHYDPELNQWIAQDPNLTENLYQIEFANPDRGWIVSTKGRILHTKNGGKTWELQETPVEEHLFSISCTDKKTAWAVGCFGTILHTDNGGKSWQRQGEKIDRIYNKVIFIDDQYGWIVGEYGVILHTQNGGKTWVEQDHDLGEVTLFSVCFKNRSQGWITGMGGRMLETSDGGENWKEVRTPVDVHLFDVDCSTDKKHSVGFQGVYIKNDGNKWYELTDAIPARSWLRDVTFLNENKGWTVGSAGAVFYTQDGGQNWEKPKN